jgi:hypothetical protein
MPRTMPATTSMPQLYTQTFETVQARRPPIEVSDAPGTPARSGGIPAPWIFTIDRPASDFGQYVNF